MNGSNPLSDPQSAPGKRRYTLLWENLGPSHHDRLRALALAGHEVTAIELFARSAVYDWEASTGDLPYDVIQLARGGRWGSAIGLVRRIVRAVLSARPDAALLCHYSDPGVFLAALWLRLRGQKVFTMLDSKVDDPRGKLPIRWLKRFMMLPYHGALTAGERSAAYARALGIRQVASHYNTLDIAALQELGESGPGVPFDERPFVIVARLIQQKNLGAALEALATYRSHGGARGLVVIGDGPEGPKLRDQALRLEIGDLVDWRGALPRAEVAMAMRQSLALLLPSISETYGFVVLEALAQGLPVIVSGRAGVIDLPINDGAEGLVIDPTRTADLVSAMERLDRGEATWRTFSDAARAAAMRGDARHFVKAIEELTGPGRG